MPEFLLDFHFWTDHLCQEDILWQTARGFLLSYLWLVCSKIDLQIAHDKGLLPSKIHWEHWVPFSRSLLGPININSLESVNRRFLYGELRLNRLNWIYRIVMLKDNPKKLIFGYKSEYNRYSVFVKRNFAWIIGAFVYITIVLTAMQVGLATDRLGKNERFQNASYAFTSVCRPWYSRRRANFTGHIQPPAGSKTKEKEAESPVVIRYNFIWDGSCLSWRWSEDGAAVRIYHAFYLYIYTYFLYIRNNIYVDGSKRFAWSTNQMSGESDDFVDWPALDMF